MTPVRRRLAAFVALSALLVLAGCAGATGPADGAGSSPTTTTSSPPATTEAPAEAPFDPTNETGLSLVLGETNTRLKGANFTYERVRRTYPPGADYWTEQRETMWVGRNGSILWTIHSWPHVFDGYRPGTGLQYERAHEPAAGTTEYSVHDHTDDLFVETLRVGPMQSLSPVPFYGPNASETTYWGIGRFEGEALHVYRLGNESDGIRLNVTLYVADDGFIRYAEGRAAVERENGTMVRFVRETYRDVNETVVEPPEWLDDARAADGR